MFSQTSAKKQTTLGFAPKQQAQKQQQQQQQQQKQQQHAVRTAKPAAAAARRVPYARQSSSSTISSSSGQSPQTGVKSRYFAAAEPSAMPRRAPAAAAAAAAAAITTATTKSSKKSIPSRVPLPTNVALSARQREAFELAVNGRESMFITGSAGTGKSVLLREIIGAFRGALRMDADVVQVTAPTGIAAVHLQGKTIHSFSGVGLGKGSPDKLLAFVRKSRNAVKRWSAVKVLIIDEVSMLDAGLLDALEYIARAVRERASFFGGIQVILTGDFYQLPPVDKDSGGGGGGGARFAFQSRAWAEGIKKTVVLTHVFRQKDMRFVDMLNEMRLGRLSEHSMGVFKGLARVPSYPDDGILATELYALRTQVDGANSRRLAALAGSAVAYSAYDYQPAKNDKNKDSREVPLGQRATDEISQKIDGACLAPRRIELKQFAQVMLIKNMPDEGLVNGSRGVVVGFSLIGAREYPVVRFTNGAELTITPVEVEVDISNTRYARMQLPIILAWALSIHKSQGQTIDRLLVDLGKVFEKGQAYVALSRAVSLDSLQVLNFAPSCVMAHPRVVEYYAALARDA